MCGSGRSGRSGPPGVGPAHLGDRVWMDGRYPVPRWDVSGVGGGVGFGVSLAMLFSYVISTITIPCCASTNFLRKR